MKNIVDLQGSGIWATGASASDQPPASKQCVMSESLPACTQLTCLFMLRFLLSKLYYTALDVIIYSTLYCSIFLLIQDLSMINAGMFSGTGMLMK